VKTLLFGLLAMLLPHFSFAANVPTGISLNTFFSCEQIDGNPWYEVGLVPFANRESGFLFVVLVHDEDTNSTTLVQEIPVLQSYPSHYTITFSDPRGNNSLSVNFGGKRLETRYDGTLALWQEDSAKAIKVNVECTQNGSISYDRVAKPQPRISVGN